MQDRSREPRSPDRKRAPPPLDAAALDRLALRYVERFATTRGKLADYLRRKVRERGWDGAAVDPDAVAGRMVELGYVDDRAFAEARAAAMTRRGLGAARVSAALRQAHVGEEDAAAVAPALAEAAVAAALDFARRRRIGPYAAEGADRALRDKQLARMVRAGHSFALARRIVAADPGEFDDNTGASRCRRDEAW
ncbi:RecX family transcriptional regulator [Sphingomonas rubra]|uniref:Regulatory protein RecX n=1 Tax=Sphingomonas rubra TaxID=634430 RepID=A0A1I5SR49_9SPHN|nr:RecX family transcriptional regulator [Sphingomonas rubra]SFP73250.1 regulatory protein [Sphingomonas rubra]